VIRLALIRLLETYFQNPIAYLILPAILAVYGAYNIFTSFEDEYVSGITIQIRPNELVQDLSLATDRSQSRFDTPSELMANEIWNLLDTDLFMTELIETVDYSKPEHYTSYQTREEIEESIIDGLQTITVNDNQIVIVMTYINADIAFALIENIYALYVDRKISDVIVDIQGASSTIDALVANAERQKLAIEEELSLYLETHPEPIDTRLDRREIEQLQIDRLEQALARVTEQHFDALAIRDETELTEVTTESSIRQSYIVLDGPISPIELTSTTDRIIALALYPLAGLGISFGIMFFIAFFNQRVLVPLDAQNSTKLPVIGVVEFDTEREKHTLLQQLFPVFAKRSRKKGTMKKVMSQISAVTELEATRPGSTARRDA